MVAQLCHDAGDLWRMQARASRAHMRQAIRNMEVRCVPWDMHQRRWWSRLARMRVRPACLVRGVGMLVFKKASTEAGRWRRL